MKNINDLREELFEAMQQLRSGKITVDQANALSQIGQVIVNSAKAEVAYLKETSGTGTGFISDVTPVKKLNRPPAEYTNSGHEKAMKKYGS
jgi:hypothetical protein